MSAPQASPQGLTHCVAVGMVAAVIAQHGLLVSLVSVAQSRAGLLTCTPQSDSWSWQGMQCNPAHSSQDVAAVHAGEAKRTLAISCIQTES